MAPVSRNLEQVLAPRFFKALGDSTRVAILNWMVNAARSEFSVSEVWAEFPLDLSVVSRHLSVLRGAGILDAERRGRRVIYRVRDAWIAATFRRYARAFEVTLSLHPPPMSRATPQRRGVRTPIRKPRTEQDDDAWRSW